MKGSVGPAWQRFGCGSMSPLGESGPSLSPNLWLLTGVWLSKIIVFDLCKIKSPSVLETCWSISQSQYVEIFFHMYVY